MTMRTTAIRLNSVPSLLALALCAALGEGPASAQAPPTAATPQAPSPPASVPSGGNCKPGEIAPRGRGMTTAQAGPSLGDRLAKSDGILCPPPNVDPEIRAPTPEAGNTPVIPPPGGPGGNPSLRPK